MLRRPDTAIAVAVALMAVAAPASQAATKRPDLTVSSVAAPGSSAALPGGSVAVTLSVRNRGAKTAPKSTLAVTVKPDGAGTARKAATLAVPKIAKGKKYEDDLDIAIPDATTPGRYAITVCADDPKKVKESNERNNCRTGSAKLVERPLPNIGPAPGNTTTTITPATTTTPAGEPESTEDVRPPARPTLSATSPTSPSNSNTPRLIGTAEAGSTVKVYLAAACTGAPVATGTAADLAGTGIEVDLPADSSNVLRATATDAAGNESTCAVGPSYVEDSTAPAAPALTGTTPATPANSNNPRILGTAEAGSTIRLFSTSDCTGTPLATGTLAAPDLQVSVADDSATDYRATATDAAGNGSTCSAPLTYTEDSTAPDPPSIGSSTGSPVNQSTVLLVGEADPGGTITVWANGTCSGTPLAFNALRQGNLWGGNAVLAQDSVNTFTATDTDAAGNASPCSSAFSITEDSTPPAAPAITISDPASPANDNTPALKGTAETGSGVSIHTESTCNSPVATGTASEFADPGIEVTVTDDSSNTFYAKAQDAAGNESDCSGAAFTYTESTPPAAPTLAFNPAGPSTFDQPQLTGSAQTDSSVDIYANGDCSGDPEATITAAQLASPGHTVNVPAVGTVTYSATATDDGGPSECSAPATYERTACNTYLDEDFSDNSANWTLGNEWQIGPATAGEPPGQGSPDPDTDATATTTDDGVAGMAIGGNRSAAVHSFAAIESPGLNTSGAGTLKLRFNRWVNSDIAQFETTAVQAHNNFDWENVATYPDTRDNSWQPVVIDITAFKGTFMQVRFGTAILTGGAFSMSGWNVDDVRVDDCP
jgi:hypothetical protein